jgi:glycosyltransferase involved in cell wall biosynthesis
LDNSRINIGICGRFEDQKGIDLLITFLNDFNDQIKNRVNFIFIGSGSYKQELQILSLKNENISLHKPINEINNKLHSFDYILMPSRFEGLALMSIEASFAKVPVIASNVKGLNETLPSDWPLFFDVFNNESLLLILKGILNNKFDPNVLS